MKYFILSFFFLFTVFFSFAQTRQDSMQIKQAALDYIESQHSRNPAQMERALHPRLVKRTVWKDKATGKEYIGETSAESMIILAENYNRKGDKFPVAPKKEVVLLDVLEKTASVKLITDEWIDYMHIVKLNDEWKILNVLWQYIDGKRHE